MTTRQYARLVSEWIGSVGLDPRLFGTHSLRASRSDRLRRTPWSWAYAAAKAGVRAMAASVSSLAMFSSRPACFLSRSRCRAFQGSCGGRAALEGLSADAAGLGKVQRHFLLVQIEPTGA